MADEADIPGHSEPGAGRGVPFECAPAGLAEMGPVLASLTAQVAELPHASVGDGMLALAQLSGQVDAALAAFTDVFDANALAVDDGARTTRQWATARTELTPAQVTAGLRRGRALRDCPHLAEAHRHGRLGTAKVGYFLTARKGLEDVFAEEEAELVDQLARLTAAHAKVLMDRWRDAALALTGREDGNDSGRDDTDANRVHLSRTFGGRWRLDGDLDHTSGSTLAAAIDAHLDRGFRSGEFNAADGTHRSKRVADALVDLAAAGSDGGERNGRPRPSIHINVDHRALLGEHADTLVEALWGWRHESASGVPIDFSTIHRLLCDADVTEILTRYNLDGTTDPLGVTHTRRHPTPAEREALVQRDQGCVYPGCDAPHGWTEAHHTVPFEIGRRTTLGELVLLCRFHHHLIHGPGHGLCRDPDTGEITTTLPGGRVHRHVPWGHKLRPTGT